MLAVDPSSQLADRNLELTFRKYEVWTEEYTNLNQGLVVTAKNKTNRTVYVYLGNTYFLRHGVATPFNTSSASQSAKDGQMAAATGFTQSVIAIPANSSLDLGTQYFFTESMGKNLFGNEFDVIYLYDKYPFFQRTCAKADALGEYEICEFAPGDIPIDFGFKLTYSFSEKDTKLYQLDAKLYVDKFVGSQGGYYYFPQKKYTIQNDPIYFKIRQGIDKRKQATGSLPNRVTPAKK